MRKRLVWHPQNAGRIVWGQENNHRKKVAKKTTMDLGSGCSALQNNWLGSYLEEWVKNLVCNFKHALDESFTESYKVLLPLHVRAQVFILPLLWSSGRRVRAETYHKLSDGMGPLPPHVTPQAGCSLIFAIVPQKGTTITLY